MTYSHYNLQNNALVDYLPHFIEQAGVKQLYCASPLSMGFFAPKAPAWHPAPSGMMTARQQAFDIVQSENWPGGIVDLALGFGLRRDRPDDSGALPQGIPTVVGLSSPDEVHQAVKVWKEVNSDSPDGNDRRRSLERHVVKCFIDAGWSNWSWDTAHLH